MDKTIFQVKGLSVFLVLVFFSAGAFAAAEDVACNAHYAFDGLKFNEFYPEKVVYDQGDEVRFTYVIENLFGSPLVQGDIKVLVMYRGPEDVDRLEDDDVLDDFFAMSDVNIQEGDKYSGTFTWKIPGKAKPGVYAVNLYFPVKKKFNIAGLTFMTSVPAATTTFEVTGADSGVFLLDKNNTYVNNKRYGFRMPIPEVELNAPVEVKTRLLNPNKEGVVVVYELFEWDDVEKRLDQYTKTETVSDARELSYEIPGLPVGVYVARITARAGDWKSIIKARFFVKGANGRFIWVGLDHFPIMSGDSTKVGVCLSNSAVSPGDASVNFTVKGAVKVIDQDGKTIAEDTYSAPITALIDGKEVKFTSPRSLTKVTVKADMYDEAGNLMDEVEIVYDYSKFLNIERNFKLEASQTGEAISYTVKYTDKYADPLEGQSVVYLIAPDEQVVYLNQKDIKGSLTGEIPTANLAEGTYTLKAVESRQYLKDTMQMTITKAKPAATTPATAPPVTAPPVVQPKKQDNTLIIIAAVVVLLIIALLAMRRRKK